MSTSTNVGRIGALAAALGVGAFMLNGTPVAWADRGSAGSTGSSSGDSAGESSPTSKTAMSSGAPGARVPRSEASNASGTVRGSERGRSELAGDPQPAAALPDVPRRGSESTTVDPQPAVPSRTATRPAPARNAYPAAADLVGPVPVADPAPVPVPPPAHLTVAPAAATSVPSIIVAAKAVAPSGTAAPGVPTHGLPAALATVADQITTAITSVVARLADGFSGKSPFAPPAESPANWALLAAARRQPAAATTATVTTGTSIGPTLLVLNGYNVVAASVQIVESFTGRWSYWPGNPNMIQGRQDFNLVDPTTQTKVGGFSALVTSGDPASIGARYAQLLVTANDGTNVGTDAGQIPPVGSMISSLSLGPFGLSYTAMPSASGDKVSAKLLTPFGNIDIPMSYDATQGIADRTFDNRPIDLGDGFSMRPADPAAEKITATIGLLPAFNSVQGRQTFGIYDATGKSVGSFKGEFTTTSDVLGISTQAILVTANDGMNVGTGPGQTPPVGTVYNVAYFEGDSVDLLYSSKPTAKGTAISITLGTPAGVVNLPKELFNSFDASRQPSEVLSAPGGQRFIATSALLPFGVNGLPPRDVQIQGYQQFEVRDLFGNKIGSVDADVQSQWDGYGVHSTSLLVTNVTAGRTGTLPFEVPPVGSVLNFVFFTGGFGFADIVNSQNGVDLRAWKFITPTGDIPLLPLPLPAVDRPRVDYVNPFAV